MPPINRSVQWIASSHVAHTCAWAIVVMFPIACLARIFDDGMGPQRWIEDCIGAFLALTVPLLCGLSCSFAHLRRKAVIERPDACALRSIIIFSGLAAILIGLVLYSTRDTPFDGLLPSGVIVSDCLIFWLLTRMILRKISKTNVTHRFGFPVVMRAAPDTDTP